MTMLPLTRRAGGEAVHVPRLKRLVYINPDQVVAPPGRARIEQCPDCDRGIYCGEKCRECDGIAWQVWKACPRCGDTAMWRYLDGRTRMHCQACGATWGVDYPGWLAQRLPARLLTARQPAWRCGRQETVRPAGRLPSACRLLRRPHISSHASLRGFSRGHGKRRVPRGDEPA